jgi:hypothetical protein
MVPQPPNKKPGPDLQTQLEDLFAAVWDAEEEWRLDDRIDLALKREPPDEQAAA